MEPKACRPLAEGWRFGCATEPTNSLDGLGAHGMPYLEYRESGDVIGGSGPRVDLRGGLRQYIP